MEARRRLYPFGERVRDQQRTRRTGFYSEYVLRDDDIDFDRHDERRDERDRCEHDSDGDQWRARSSSPCPRFWPRSRRSTTESGRLRHSDSAANITANLDQLDDPNIAAITISDNGNVGASIQQLTSKARRRRSASCGTPTFPRRCSQSPIRPRIFKPGCRRWFEIDKIASITASNGPMVVWRSHSWPISRRSIRSLGGSTSWVRRPIWRRTSISSTIRTSLGSRFLTTARSALRLRSSRPRRRRSATCKMRTGLRCCSRSMIRLGMFKPACRRWFKIRRDRLHHYVRWADRRFGGHFPGRSADARQDRRRVRRLGHGGEYCREPLEPQRQFLRGRHHG